MPQKLTTIFKVTESCNLECSYCLRNKHQSNFIGIDTIKLYFEKISKLNFSQIKNIWHGGEPLLLKPDFYEEAINIAKFYCHNVPIVNTIQTNGTLITDDFINLFSRFKIKVGVSLDGSKEIHDSSRIGKNFKSTFDIVSQNINNLKSAKIDFGLLTLFSRKTIGKEQETYSTLKELSKYARINFYTPSGIGKNKEKEFSFKPEEAGKSLIKFYDIWKIDNSNFRLGPFVEIVSSMISGSNKLCEYNKSCCNDFVALDPDGNIYPCGRFSYDQSLKVGNLFSTNFNTEILNKEIGITRLKNINVQCNNCEFKYLCEGGCAHHSLSINGDLNNKSPFCETYKILFNHIFKSLS